MQRPHLFRILTQQRFFCCYTLPNQRALNYDLRCSVLRSVRTSDIGNITHQCWANNSAGAILTGTLFGYRLSALADELGALSVTHLSWAKNSARAIFNGYFVWLQFERPG